LPLNDYASFELARSLLVADPASRDAVLVELLSVDPALALWTACRAAQDAEGPVDAPRCVRDLARWLSARLLAVLCWPSLDESEARLVRDMPARWRELAADSVAVARLAADQAADEAGAAEAFLLGLLHNASDWLRSCGPRVSLATGCLPAWLVGPLRERARSSRRPSVELVVRALDAWHQAGRRGRRIGSADLGDVARARKRWQACRSDRAETGHVVRLLTGRLRQLEELEARFDHAVEQAKLASLGELAYGASHEVNNPLANISTRAQALLAQEADPEKRRMLAIINAQAFRANEMIADMMMFARPPALVRQPLDLVALVDRVVAELAEDARLQDSLIARVGDSTPVFIDGDETQLATALRALCVNALEALIAHGQVDVSVSTVDRAPGDAQSWARIAVHDTGPGIPAHVRPHIFDPFFSGREAGRGLGFGLSKCWRVVTLHGGRVNVVSLERQGTTFTLDLPLLASAVL